MWRRSTPMASGRKSNVVWDDRCRPRCTTCGQAMRINRKTPQSALDLPLGCASVVMLLYEAVQGFCTRCAHYRDRAAAGDRRAPSRDPALDAAGQLALPLAADAAGLRGVCRSPPATAWRYDRFILQTELPEPNLDGLEAIIIDEKHLGKSGFITQCSTPAPASCCIWPRDGAGRAGELFRPAQPGAEGPHSGRRRWTAVAAIAPRWSATCHTPTSCSTSSTSSPTTTR